MTRITINWDELSLKAEGHTTWGNPGENIVCAAISTVTLTLLNTLMDCKERGRIDMEWSMDEKEGRLEIKTMPGIGMRHELWCYFRMASIGLQAIKQEYPKEIRLNNIGGMQNGAA